MRISLPLSRAMTPVCFTAISSLIDDGDGLDAVAHLDAVDHLHALGDLAEHRVLAVQEVGGLAGDVELAARGVGIVGAGHGDHSPHVLLLVELRLDRVAGPARAQPPIAGLQGLGLRVAALGHGRILLHTVEGGAVVEAFPGQGDDVLHRLGRIGGEELDGDVAAVGHGDDGDGGGRGRRLRVLREGGRDDEGDQGESDEKRAGHGRTSVETWAASPDYTVVRGTMDRCSRAIRSVILPSSLTSITARPRWWTRCSGSPSSSAPTSRCPSASWTPSTSSARRASPSWPRTRPSPIAASVSTSWTPRAMPTSARRSSAR